jgi:hypothetical protein
VRDVIDAVKRHPESFGDELRETRLVALPRGNRPYHQLDPAPGQYRGLYAVAWCTWVNLDAGEYSTVEFHQESPGRNDANVLIFVERQ